MKSCCVLLVEDNPVHQHIISCRLEPMGCQIDKAATVAEAIKLACQNKYDLILLDIGLPDGDGREVSRFIRSSEHLLSYDAYIIAQTAHVSARDTKLCQEAGINTVLSKPLNYSLLEKIVINLSGFSHVYNNQPISQYIYKNEVESL